MSLQEAERESDPLSRQTSDSSPPRGASSASLAMTGSAILAGTAHYDRLSSVVRRLSSI